MVDGMSTVGAIVTTLNSRWMFSIRKATLKIGCENKSWEEWELWFAGEEEFDTERGTESFNRIEEGFQMAKTLKRRVS